MEEEDDLVDRSGADHETLDELNRAIAESEPLMHGAGRAVLGEGPSSASIALVGEQPGEQEDIQGRPFVGPAGKLLDRALHDAGLDRGRLYLTNAVKNFKFELRGKRRIHQKPTAGEVRRYRFWLERELDLVKPDLVVALGGTAAMALAGRSIAVGRHRGAFRFGYRAGFITVHPSFLLRMPEGPERDAAYAAFVDDLKQIRAIAERR